MLKQQLIEKTQSLDDLQGPMQEKVKAQNEQLVMGVLKYQEENTRLETENPSSKAKLAGYKKDMSSLNKVINDKNMELNIWKKKITLLNNSISYSNKEMKLKTEIIKEDEVILKELDEKKAEIQDLLKLAQEECYKV